MNQSAQEHANPGVQISIYSLFGFGAVPKIEKGITGLDETVREAYNRQISNDRAALSPSATQADYEALENRLVNNLGSDQSYGSVAVNEVSGKYADTINYIHFLQTKYKTDPKRIKILKVAVIKSLIQRIPDYAERSVAKPEKMLYEKALRELKSKKPV